MFDHVTCQCAQSIAPPGNSYPARFSASDFDRLIEVADSTLHHDLNDKRDLFAEAGVPEYWVVDIPHRLLIAHLDQQQGRYRSIQTFDEHQNVRPQLIPEIQLAVATLFR